MATRAANYLFPLHLRGLNIPGLLNRSRTQVSHIWITTLWIPLISHSSPFLQSSGHEPLALQVPSHYQVKIWGWGWCKCKGRCLWVSYGEKKKKNQTTPTRETGHRGVLILLGRELRGKRMSLSFLLFTYSRKNKVKLISQWIICHGEVGGL